MLKKMYEKKESKQIVNHPYKDIQWSNFWNDLECALNSCDNKIDRYQESFAKVFGAQAPLKVCARCIRRNQKPHIDKTLRKVIFKRSRLELQACLAENSTDIKYYGKQRNVVVKLNREFKKEYFEKIPK